MTAAAGDLLLVWVIPALAAVWLVLLVVSILRGPRTRATRWRRELDR
jgi:hypothetical protein